MSAAGTTPFEVFPVDLELFVVEEVDWAVVAGVSTAAATAFTRSCAPPSLGAPAEPVLFFFLDLFFLLAEEACSDVFVC